MSRSVRALAVAALSRGCTPEPALGAPDPTDAGSEAPPAATDTTSATTSTSTAETGGSGPPVVIDMGKDADTLTEGGVIVVTATVRDPDGDDDVVGGWLLLADSDLEVAAFVPAENGRFTAPLSWADLQALDPPTFTATSTLRLRGRFTDTAGEAAEGETSVLLVCAGLSGAACDGTCVDLEAHDENCGACANACEIGVSPVTGEAIGGCDHGRCEPTLTGCASATRFANCTEVCAGLGRRCASGCEGGFVAFQDGACTEGGQQPGSTGCDEDAFGWPSGGSVACCCDPAR